MKPLFDNGDQHVSGDGAPDLRFDRVLAVADEAFDTQMLLDPLEEQFDLPAAFVQCGGQCRQYVLLVRNTNVLPVSGSLKRMRLSCSG